MAYQPTFGASGDPIGDGGNTDNGTDNASDNGSVPFFLGGSSSDSGSGDSRDAAGNEFDELIHSGRDKFNADGTFRKRRGRRAGSSGSESKRGGGKASSYSASVDSLAFMIGTLNLGIATMSKFPDFATSEEENQKLAQASARVLEEFDLRPSPKAEAIVGLIVATGSVYGPRVYLYANRKKKVVEVDPGAN